MKVKDILSTMRGIAVIVHSYMDGEQTDSERIVYYTRRTEPERLPAAVKLFADREISKMYIENEAMIIQVHDEGVEEFWDALSGKMKRGEMV